MAKKEKKQGGQSILTMDLSDLMKQLKTKDKVKTRKGLVTENKRTMNFARKESGLNLTKVLPVIIVISIILTVFFKVGIVDPLSQKSRAYSQLARKQEELAAVQTRLGEYDELAEKYGRYSYGLMNESEINLVNRMDVLDLLVNEIAPYAFIENFAVNNNVMTLNIYGITLDQASSLVNRLESNSLVTQATVNSATADDGVEARIFISINLTKVVEEAE